jgi:hypothetical protein
MKRIILVLITILLVNCQERKDILQEEIQCCCPPTIYLQPCNNYTQKEAKQLIPKLQKAFIQNSFDSLDFIILPTIQLSNSLKNESKTRYRADKIIHSIEDNQHDMIILLTHEDISLPYKGHKDWGVLGLSISPKHVCITSDYRLKNKKRDYWKVILHEFAHSYFKASHCPDDNPTCIMKDAKGHADFSNKNKICSTCMNKIYNQ